MNGTTPFFRPGGTMEPTAPSYIERAADAQLFEALSRGEYVFLLDSRQKGKSSMVARAIVKLRKRGVSTVKLDLQRLGSNVTPEQWYAGLVGEIGAELGLTNDLFQYWGDRTAVGPLARWIGALKDVVLRKTTAPLVVFIDEIDFVRALPFPTDEFFAGIRDCYNRRSEQIGFERLTFCLVGVATPGQLIRNPEITPFNIGARIDVSDFTLEESKPFVEALSVGGRNGRALFSRVHHWLSGHPYLTQLLCSRIASDDSIAGNSDVDRLVKSLFLTPESRQREPNFADVERRMLDPDVPGLSDEEKRTQVLELYGRVLKGKPVAAAEENPVVATLRLSGVGLEDRSSLRIRNRLYGMVFDEKWRRQSLPDAEMRRQRGAARLALIRATAVAGVIVLGVTAVALNMNRLANDRSKAIIRLESTSSDLNNLSKAQAKSLSDITKRTKELQRVTQEKQRSLTQLGLRTGELQRTSQDRAKALSQLGEQNSKLARLSVEKDAAIRKLNEKSADLARQNYAGKMAAIRSALQLGSWSRVSRIVQETSTSSSRGWEWDYLHSLTNGSVFETSLDTQRLEFEYDRAGNLSVVTPDYIARVTPGGLTNRRNFHGKKLHPVSRNPKGFLRVGLDPDTGRYVYRQSETDEFLGAMTGWNGPFIGVDPIEKRILVKGPRGAFEYRSLDGSRVLQSLEWTRGEHLIQVVWQGGAFGLFRDGTIRRFDKDGVLLKNENFEPYFSQGGYRIGSNRSTNQLMWFVSEVNSGRIRVYNDDLKCVCEVFADHLMPPMVSPDGRFLVVTSGDGLIRLFDVRSARLIREFAGHKWRIIRQGFLPDSKHFVTCDIKGTLKVWNVDSSPPLTTVAYEDDPPEVSVLTSGGRFLLTQSSLRNMISREISTGREVRLAHDPVNPMADWEFEGENVFLGYNSGEVARYELPEFKAIKKTQIFKAPISKVLVVGNGRRLYVETIDDDGPYVLRYAILDAKTLAILHRGELEPFPGIVEYIDQRADSKGTKVLLSILHHQSPDPPFLEPVGSRLVMISTETGEVTAQRSFANAVPGSAISPDGATIYAAIETAQMSLKSRIVALSTETLAEVRSLEAPPRIVTKLLESPDGSRIAGWSTDDRLYIWDSRTGKITANIVTPSQNMGVFTLKGDRLVRAQADGSFVFYDTATGEDLVNIYYPPVQTKTVRQEWEPSRQGYMTLSEDGSKLVASCSDGAVRIFDSRPMKAVRTPSTSRIRRK